MDMMNVEFSAILILSSHYFINKRLQQFCLKKHVPRHISFDVKYDISYVTYVTKLIINGSRIMRKFVSQVENEVMAADSVRFFFSK